MVGGGDDGHVYLHEGHWKTLGASVARRVSIYVSVLQGFEVVFISSDRDQESFDDYFKEARLSLCSSHPQHTRF